MIAPRCYSDVSKLSQPHPLINFKKTGWKESPSLFSEHRGLQCRPFRICTRVSSFIFVLRRLLDVITHSCQLGMRGSVFVLPPGTTGSHGTVKPSLALWVCKESSGWSDDVQKVGWMCERMCACARACVRVCALLRGFLGNSTYLSIVLHKYIKRCYFFMYLFFWLSFLFFPLWLLSQFQVLSCICRVHV